MPAVRGARPVRNKEIQDFHWHLDSNDLKNVTLLEYEKVWREWINYSNTKSLRSLENFTHVD